MLAMQSDVASRAAASGRAGSLILGPNKARQQPPAIIHRARVTQTKSENTARVGSQRASILSSRSMSTCEVDPVESEQHSKLCHSSPHQSRAERRPSLFLLHGHRRTKLLHGFIAQTHGRTDGAANRCEIVLLTPLKGKREEFSSLPSPRLQLLQLGWVAHRVHQLL